MALRRPGDNPLSEPMMVSLLIYASLSLNELDGLSKFCSKNKSIVNVIKSKSMIFGQMESYILMATLLNASMSIKM